jgi:hypothetical protein
MPFFAVVFVVVVAFVVAVVVYIVVLVSPPLLTVAMRFWLKSVLYVAAAEEMWSCSRC